LSALPRDISLVYHGAFSIFEPFHFSTTRFLFILFLFLYEILIFFKQLFFPVELFEKSKIFDF